MTLQASDLYCSTRVPLTKDLFKSHFASQPLELVVWQLLRGDISNLIFSRNMLHLKPSCLDHVVPDKEVAYIDMLCFKMVLWVVYNIDSRLVVAVEYWCLRCLYCFFPQLL